MIKTKSTDEFCNKVLETIKNYTEDVTNAVVDEVELVAQEGKEKLQLVIMPEASENGTAHYSTRRTWKKYSSSWDVKTQGGKKSNFIRCRIHNKKYYRLTHLLEYGHATRDGKHTRAFRHIDPIEVECEKKLENNIPKIIEKGGKL